MSGFSGQTPTTQTCCLERPLNHFLSKLSFLFLDSGREGLWTHFHNTFPSAKLTKKFYITYSQASVKLWRDIRCPSGASLSRGVMNLPSVECVLVQHGRNFQSLVGNRDNKVHPGSTETNVITNVRKAGP